MGHELSSRRRWRRHVAPDAPRQPWSFFASAQGFLHLRFTPDHAVGRILDDHDDELHLFDRSIDGSVRVIFTTGTQPATTQPLRVIQGLDTPATQPSRGSAASMTLKC